MFRLNLNLLNNKAVPTQQQDFSEIEPEINTGRSEIQVFSGKAIENTFHQIGQPIDNLYKVPELLWQGKSSFYDI